MTSSIYVASSWRNKDQSKVVSILRNIGFNVYDFRNPGPGDKGFHWSEIDPKWQSWTENQYIESLKNPISEDGYKKDFNAMAMADTCVLLLPSGRSAHLEAGWFVGVGKSLYIVCTEPTEPELMYKMADGIFPNIKEMTEFFRTEF